MAALREARDECAFTAALETAWRRDATGARWTAPEALEKTRKAKRRRRARLAERQLRSKKRRGSADAVAHGDDDDDAPAETFIQIRPFDAAKTSVAAGSESAQPLVLGTRAVLRALEDPAPKLAAVVVCAKQEAVDIEIRQRVLDACAARQIPAFALVETTPQLLGKAMRLRSVMTLAFAQRSALGADMRQALDILGA